VASSTQTPANVDCASSEAAPVDRRALRPVAPDAGATEGESDARRGEALVKLQRAVRDAHRLLGRRGATPERDEQRAVGEARRLPGVLPYDLGDRGCVGDAREEYDDEPLLALESPTDGVGTETGAAPVTSPSPSSSARTAAPSAGRAARFFASMRIDEIVQRRGELRTQIPGREGPLPAVLSPTPAATCLPEKAASP